jgi:hypothetical protein
MTKVTGAGLKALARTHAPPPASREGGLTKLHVALTSLTDSDLKELAPLRGLVELDLRGTKVSDAGLKELVPLRELGSLWLTGTRVTDGGFKVLARV